MEHLIQLVSASIENGLGDDFGRRIQTFEKKILLNKVLSNKWRIAISTVFFKIMVGDIN